MTNGALTEQDATALLREFAKKNNIYRLMIGNWSAWRILAFPISLELMNIPFISCNSNTLSNQLFLTWPLFKDFIAFLSAKNASYFMKTYASALIDVVDSRYKDIYVDDLILTLGDSFKMEQFVNRGYCERSNCALIPRQSNGLFIRYAANVLSKFHVPIEISNVSKQLSSLVAKDLGLSSVTQDVIQKHLCRFHYYKNLYKHFLNRVRPKCVLVPSTCDYELLAASKELGIQYIELQHGIMTRNHPDVLTEYELELNPFILHPDKIFVFGEHWKNEISSQGFYNKEICVVGNSRIDAYRRDKELHGINRGKPVRILITTQGFCTGEIIEFMQRFLRLTAAEDFSITFKLHPMRENNKQVYEEAFRNNRNVKIYLGSDLPNTFELLTQSDFHVSISSACHYDALGLGVPTIILPFQCSDVVSDLIKRKHAVLVKSPDDLARVVKNSVVVDDDIKHHYFAPFLPDKIKTYVM